ncbi:MAG: NUDIX domain-containing protein [Chloroflexi bacterium]|nr:NUDIX domain-containing protein [Chloroflexota bacterium]
MRIRAGCILIENDKLALIERHRGGRHYFTFPGGGVDDGESHEQAAIREMEEETGLQVKVIRKIADVHFNGNLQPYFLVEKVSGEYGTGIGEEFGEYDPMFGTYHPVWMPVADILDHPVVPRPLAEVVLRSAQSSWPNEPVVIFDS